MGAAAPIVGAGLSVVGGLTQANSQRRQADAQKKAIQAQAEVEQLNSRLQLLNINQQQQLAEVQSQLQSAAEKQAYIGRLAAIEQQETYNAMQLSQAGLQARTQEQLAGAQQAEANVQSLQQLVGAEGQIGRELVQAIASSGTDQANLLKRMQEMPDNARASYIANLMDLAASAGGANEALRLLGESTTTTTAGQVSRASEMQGTQAQLAKDSATALRASAEATRAGTLAQAGLQNADATFAARQQALDVQTSGKVASAAFASERTATEAAYQASGLARGVEDSARNASVAVNREVLERGATLSAATAQAQASAVRSPGFFDYVGILGGGATTYMNMGGTGNFGFLNQRSSPSSSAIRKGTDVTNYNYNIG